MSEAIGESRALTQTSMACGNAVEIQNQQWKITKAESCTPVKAAPYFNQHESLSSSLSPPSYHLRGELNYGFQTVQAFRQLLLPGDSYQNIEDSGFERSDALPSQEGRLVRAALLRYHRRGCSSPLALEMKPRLNSRPKPKHLR